MCSADWPQHDNQQRQREDGGQRVDDENDTQVGREICAHDARADNNTDQQSRSYELCPSFDGKL